MRVLVLIIASHGTEYESLKAEWTAHVDAHCPTGVDVRFLYGVNDPLMPEDYAWSDRDLVYPVKESTYGAVGCRSGVLDKTLLALKNHDGYDYVVRTNLSSWYHFDKLLRFLEAAPRKRFAAGFSPTKDHLSGCNIIVSGDVAADLAAYGAYGRDLDDLEISKALSRMGVSATWVPRIDILNKGGIVPHEEHEQSFHVRLKQPNRADDASCFRALTAVYAPSDTAWGTVKRIADVLLERNGRVVIGQEEPGTGRTRVVSVYTR